MQEEDVMREAIKRIRDAIRIANSTGYDRASVGLQDLECLLDNHRDLRARVRELEGIVSRHGRQGEAAIDAVCAMDAEASHG
jgi:hypothetical protein